MKKRTNQKFVRIFVMLIFIGMNQVFAQFTLSGEFRPRAEYRHGYKTLVMDDDLAAFQISQTDVN